MRKYRRVAASDHKFRRVSIGADIPVVDTSVVMSADNYAAGAPDGGNNDPRHIMEVSLTTYLETAPPGEVSERRQVAKIIRDHGTLTSEKPIVLDTLRSITALPEGFNPRRVSLRRCTSLERLPAGFNPHDVNLQGCASLTALPAEFNPKGFCDLSGCCRLTALPVEFNPRDARLRFCESLTHLPDSFNPQGDIDLDRCEALSTLPTGFIPQGDVYMRYCVGFSVVPESLFAMRSEFTVDLGQAGLSASSVATIIRRMNTPGYNGPQFILSVNDGGYRSESQATAVQLPYLIASTGKDPGHPLWESAATQTDMGNPWNGFAAFVTRLLNETPRDNRRVPEALSHRLYQLFTAMEADFERNGTQLDRCELINSVLSAAQTSIGTCIDKVKVGYVLMQLQVEKSQGVPDADRKIALVNRTIELVEGINSGDVVLDQATGQFVPVRVDFSDDDRYRVQVGDIHLELSVDASTPLVDVKRIGIADINTEHGARFKGFRIGDEVEDILNLIYHLPEMDTLHKIDMRFAGCRTIIAEHEVAAAVQFATNSTDPLD